MDDFLSDEELDELLKTLESTNIMWIGGIPKSIVKKAARAIRELKSRRDELQQSIDDIALGRI